MPRSRFRMSRTFARMIGPLTMASLLAWASVAGAQQAVSTRGDALDELVREKMGLRQIPAVSLAIVQGGRIVDARAYGSTVLNGGTPITPNTIFQAASISKSLTALGVLHLVEAGTLSLDKDVNTQLKTWKIPENPFTVASPVTVHRLLNHTAGTTVRGIPGHPTYEVLPPLVDALSGRGNTVKVEVRTEPGTAYQYSGGGYSVLQQLVEDVAGKPFATYMQQSVLKPLGMTASTFEVPLPPAMRPLAPIGHTLGRRPIDGGWHDIRQVAAAGLWTTPTDLARYLIGVFDAIDGRSTIISAAMARQMTTPDSIARFYGFGLSAEGTGKQLRFYHGGQNHGFESYITGNPVTRNGAVIMLNANDGGRFMWQIMSFLAKKYQWDNYPIDEPEAVKPVAIEPQLLEQLKGDYQFVPGQTWGIRLTSGRLWMYRNALPDEEFVQAPDGRFVSVDRQVSFKPLRNAAGRIDAIEWHERGEQRRVPRLGS
jgi:CubicO group peptidase (beta-lactamase class C family)